MKLDGIILAGLLISHMTLFDNGLIRSGVVFRRSGARGMTRIGRPVIHATAAGLGELEQKQFGERSKGGCLALLASMALSTGLGDEDEDED